MNKNPETTASPSATGDELVMPAAVSVAMADCEWDDCQRAASARQIDVEPPRSWGPR